MKQKIITLLSLCFAAALLSGAVPLLKNGKAAGKIYLSKNASEGEKTAAKELQEYLKKSSGICKRIFVHNGTSTRIHQNRIPLHERKATRVDEPLGAVG